MGKRFDYEYIIIGGGIAGLSAAKQLARAGRKVAVVEKSEIGGKYINDYDIASRTLFHISHSYAQIKNSGPRYGLSFYPHFDYGAMMSWKNQAIQKAYTMKDDLEKMGVTFIKGSAKFVGTYDIEVENTSFVNEKHPESTKLNLSANRFLIATGTEPDNGGISGLDEVPYLTPAAALATQELPKTALIIGGGPTGCEIAEYYAELGVKVVIVELSDRILPDEDEDISQILSQYFEKKLGIKIFTQTRVVALEKDKISTRAVFMRKGEEKTVRIGTAVLATGSRPTIAGLDLKNAGVSFDKKGIIINRTLQTTARHVYVAGDVLGGHSSSELAIYTGEIAVMNMLGHTKTFINYDGFMYTVNTCPEIAVVGMTEVDLTKRSRKYHKAFSALSATSNSITTGEQIGFVKILADHQGKILGASMLGPNASEVLQEVAFAVRHGLSLTEIASTPHPEGDWSNLVRLTARKLLTKR